MEDLDFLLVVMLVHLFDEDGLDDSAFAFDVDNPVGIAETDSAIPEPLAFEAVIAIARDRASRLKAFESDQVNPKRELADDVLWELLELVLRGSRQFNIQRATVPQFWVQSRSDGTDA